MSYPSVNIQETYIKKTALSNNTIPNEDPPTLYQSSYLSSQATLNQSIDDFIADDGLGSKSKPKPESTVCEVSDLNSALRALVNTSRPITNLSTPQFLLNYCIYPLLSGFMAGMGEMCATELAILWKWRSSPIFFFERK